MTFFYIKFSPDHQPVGWMERRAPLEGHETKESAQNKQAYLAEATVQGFEPFNPKTQVRTGPVLEASPPVIRYTVRNKTPAERDTERQARIESHISPAIMALAKNAGLTRAQLRVLIAAELA